MTWTHQAGDRYLVVGELRNGAKFRDEYANPHYAMAINLYRGRVYVVRDGRRWLLKTVWN